MGSKKSYEHLMDWHAEVLRAADGNASGDHDSHGPDPARRRESCGSDAWTKSYSDPEEMVGGGMRPTLIVGTKADLYSGRDLSGSRKSIAADLMANTVEVRPSCKLF